MTSEPKYLYYLKRMLSLCLLPPTVKSVAECSENPSTLIRFYNVLSNNYVMLYRLERLNWRTFFFFIIDNNAWSERKTDRHFTINDRKNCNFFQKQIILKTCFWRVRVKNIFAIINYRWDIEIFTLMKWSFPTCATIEPPEERVRNRHDLFSLKSIGRWNPKIDKKTQYFQALESWLCFNRSCISIAGGNYVWHVDFIIYTCKRQYY